MQSICMCLHCLEGCTHLHMVRTGFCQKCERHNWGDVPGDNLWSDSATEDSGNVGTWGI